MSFHSSCDPDKKRFVLLKDSGLCKLDIWLFTSSTNNLEIFIPIKLSRLISFRLQEEREILMYCDLHGHSRKKNIFIYGCESKYVSISC